MKKLVRQICALALSLLFCSISSAAQKPILFDTVDLPELPQDAPVPLLDATRLPKHKSANLEGEIFDEINSLRRNPQLYAAGLAEYRRYFAGKELRLPGQTAILTDEGVAALDEAIAFLRRARPTQSFINDRSLTSAALDHVRDIQASGKIGHYDSRGDSPIERVLRYGMWSGELQELVSYYSATPRQIVFSLLVDDGVPTRGHRGALLKSNLKSVGIKTGDSAKFGKLCVIVLTESFVENAE